METHGSADSRTGEMPCNHGNPQTYAYDKHTHTRRSNKFISLQQSIGQKMSFKSHKSNKNGENSAENSRF